MVSKNGWAGLLGEQFIRKADILNRGYSGYNTRWALKIKNQLFDESSSKDVVVVTIFFGITAFFAQSFRSQRCLFVKVQRNSTRPT